MNEPQPTVDDALAAIRTLQEATAITVTRIDGEVASLRSDMNRRFDRVDQRFDAVDRRFDAMEQHFQGLFDELKRLIVEERPKRRRPPKDRE